MKTLAAILTLGIFGILAQLSSGGDGISPQSRVHALKIDTSRGPNKGNSSGGSSRNGGDGTGPRRLVIG